MTSENFSVEPFISIKPANKFFESFKICLSPHCKVNTECYFCRFDFFFECANTERDSLWALGTFENSPWIIVTRAGFIRSTCKIAFKIGACRIKKTVGKSQNLRASRKDVRFTIGVFSLAEIENRFAFVF